MSKNRKPVSKKSKKSSSESQPSIPSVAERKEQVRRLLEDIAKVSDYLLESGESDESGIPSTFAQVQVALDLIREEAEIQLGVCLDIHCEAHGCHAQESMPQDEIDELYAMAPVSKESH